MSLQEIEELIERLEATRRQTNSPVHLEKYRGEGSGRRPDGASGLRLAEANYRPGGQSESTTPRRPTTTEAERSRARTRPARKSTMEATSSAIIDATVAAKPCPNSSAAPPLTPKTGSDVARPGNSAMAATTAPPEPPRRTVVKLPRYNGGEPAETYLIQVELAAQLNGWTQEETAVQVALSLEGRALQILIDLQPNERGSWSALERAIQHRFGQRVYPDDLRDQLANRMRIEGESLGGYAADLRLYTRRGHPNFDAETQEELALQAFIRGLRPERLREHIRLHSPATLTAALIEAERVEHVLGVTTRPHGTRQRVNKVDCEESDDEESARQVTPAPVRQPRRLSRRQPTEGCYRCGAPGHIARYCPAPEPLCQSPEPQLN